MAIPEGYEKLAAIGIAYQGEYKGGTAYKLLHAVYYSGSTYVALKDNPSAPPAADNTNWMYLAKGFTEGVMSAINAADASGILGTAGGEVNAQALIDAIAERAVDSILQNKIVNNLLATDPATVLAGTQGKALDTRVTELTRKLSVFGTIYRFSPATDVALDTTALKAIITGELTAGTYIITCAIGYSVISMLRMDLIDAYTGSALCGTLSGATTMTCVSVLKQSMTLQLKCRGDGVINRDFSMNYINAVKLK